MATLGYPPHHDNGFGFGRAPSLSRRPSHHSAYGGKPQVAFPYGDQHTGLQGEPYHHQPSYPVYPQSDRRSRHMPEYDDLSIHDPYYHDDRRSAGVPHTPLPHRQRRRSSSVAFDMRPHMDTFRRSSPIKLKRKGAYRTGLTIGDAQANARLSGNDSYTFQDFNADMTGRIHLKIRWAGYQSLTYDVPLDGYGDRVNLQTLARRTARAVVHFLQTNIIPVPWDCVEMLQLEEVAPGTWQPVLAVR